MKPSLSQVCSLHSSFAEEVEHYAAGQCHAIEVWLTKLEEHLKTHTLDDVQQLIESHGVELPVASLQGGLFASDEAAGSASWQHFEQRLALCAQLGIATLVVAADLSTKPTQAEVERLRTILVKAADAARGARVRLAVEFQSRATFANNLETAAALVGQCGHEQLGICLDTFQLWTGPSRIEDLAYLTNENLFHVHVSDLVGVPRELASDADRILPGEGDLPLEVMVEHLRTIGYQDYVSIELMNPQIWQVPPRQFGEIAMTAIRRLLGQADMGTVH